MHSQDIDQIANCYRWAVKRWIEAIRAQEAHANGDHSMKQMQRWDDAGFSLRDAESAAKKARDAYKDAVRRKNYGF
jgi:hypothetical protein